MEVRHTRKDYMEKKVSHHDYYKEYVELADIRPQSIPFSVEELEEALNKDKNLNSIALRKWDSIGSRFNTSKVHKISKLKGSWVSQATLVCIAKTAARMKIGVE